MLADRSIRAAVEQGELKIEPFDEDRLQPASYDVTLDNEFRVFNNHGFVCIDPKESVEPLTEIVRVSLVKSAMIPDYFVLHPGEFVLGQTVERVVIPDDIVSRIEGKSSLGRVGVLVHATAGFIDPGFEGRLTLELSNQATVPIKLYPGMSIGQLSFQWTDQPVETPYNGKYQGDLSPTASRLHQDFKED